MTTLIEGVGRGTTMLEVDDNGGYDGVDGTVLVYGVTSFVVNPSLEATGPGVGYGPILAWSGGSGINNASQPFFDNGLAVDRDHVAFLQGGQPAWPNRHRTDRRPEVCVAAFLQRAQLLRRHHGPSRARGRIGSGQRA